MQWLMEKQWPWRRPAAIAAAVVLLAASGTTDAGRLVHPRIHTQLRPVIAYVHARSQPGDVLYVGGHSLEVLYYWGKPAPQRIIDQTPGADAPYSRFWYIAAAKPKHMLRDVHAILASLGRNMRQTDRFMVPGGAAFLFEK